MALWPAPQGGSVAAGVVTSAASAVGVAVISGAAAHVKGAWTEIVTTTDRAYDMLTLGFPRNEDTSAADRSSLLDIGFGAAGSERVVVANILRGNTQGGATMQLPIRIPPGTRVSARVQNAGSSADTRITTHLSGNGGWAVGPVARRAVTYGADTATSGGVGLTPSATNNVKGVWSELTPSTTTASRWLMPRLSGPPGDTSWVSNEYFVDVGIGAAGSEVVLLPDLPVRTVNTEALIAPHMTFPVDLPAGVRLSARIAARVAAGVDTINCSVVTFD